MKLIVLFWLVALSLPLGWALGFHNAPHKLSAVHGLRESEGYQLHHIIGGECQCSQRVLQHLLHRKKLAAFEETIYLVGNSGLSPEEMKKAGFRVVTLDEEEARSRHGITSVPFLAVTRGKAMLYAGGYARNQQHAESFDDEKIAAQLLRGEVPEEFSVFGCANGRVSKKALDPWGVKYGNN